MKALVERLRALPLEDITRILADCPAEGIAALRWAWPDFWARLDERAPGATVGRGQLPPPGDWTWWILLGGRAGGKTRPAAEYISSESQRLGKGCTTILLAQSLEIGRRDMIDGPSGLGTISPPWAGFDYKPSLNRATWKSGAVAYMFGADNVDAARGPNACRFWADDLAAFGPKGFAVFQILTLALRLDAPDGSSYRGVMSTTPIDSEILRHVMEAREGKRASSYVFSESATDDNKANLSAKFLTETMADIAGTELEQQERFGRLDLANTPKVFSGVSFEAAPVRVDMVPERFDLVVVSIDPADSSSTKACEVGIVAGGLANTGHGYLLEDASGHLNSDQWPDTAWDLVERWAARCNRWRFVVEINRGTKDSSLLRARELIRRLQRGLPGVSVCEIRTVTSRVNKAERAAPLPLIYRAGQMHHARGLVEVERQLRVLDNTGRGLLDRADAAVYCELDLFGLLDSSQPGPAIGGASMSFAAVGPRPQQAVAVGPMPSQGPRTTSAASFQSAAMPGQVRR